MLDSEKEWYISVDRDVDLDLLDTAYPFPTYITGRIVRHDKDLHLSKYKSPHDRTPPPKAIKMRSNAPLSQFKSESTRFRIFYEHELHTHTEYTKKTCIPIDLPNHPIFTLEIHTGATLRHQGKGHGFYEVKAMVTLKAESSFDFALAIAKTQDENGKTWHDYSDKTDSKAQISVYKVWQHNNMAVKQKLKKKSISSPEDDIDYSNVTSRKMKPLLDMHILKQKKSAREVIKILSETSLYQDFLYFMSLQSGRIIHTFMSSKPVGVVRFHEGDRLLEEVIWEFGDQETEKKICIRPSSLQAKVRVTIWLHIEYICYYANKLNRKLITCYNMDCKLYIHHYHRKLSSFSHPSIQSVPQEIISSKTNDSGYCELEFLCKNRLFKTLDIGNGSMKTKVLVRTQKDTALELPNEPHDTLKWERGSLFHLLDRYEDETMNLPIDSLDLSKDLALVCFEDLNSAYIHDYDSISWSRERHTDEYRALSTIDATTTHWSLKLDQWILQSILSVTSTPETYLLPEVYGLVHTITKNNPKHVLLNDFNETSEDIHQYDPTCGWNMWIMLEYVKNMSISSLTSSYPDTLGKLMVKLIRFDRNPGSLLRLRTAQVIQQSGTKVYQAPSFSLPWHHFCAIAALYTYAPRTKDRKLVRDIGILIHEQLKIIEIMFDDGNLKLKDYIPCIASVNLSLKSTFMQPYFEEIYKLQQKMIVGTLQRLEKERSKRDLNTLCFITAVFANPNLTSLCDILRLYDPMEANCTIKS